MVLRTDFGNRQILNTSLPQSRPKKERIMVKREDLRVVFMLGQEFYGYKSRGLLTLYLVEANLLKRFVRGRVVRFTEEPVTHRVRVRGSVVHLESPFGAEDPRPSSLPIIEDE